MILVCVSEEGAKAHVAVMHGMNPPSGTCRTRHWPVEALRGKAPTRPCLQAHADKFAVLRPASTQGTTFGAFPRALDKLCPFETLLMSHSASVIIQSMHSVTGQYPHVKRVPDATRKHAGQHLTPGVQLQGPHRDFPGSLIPSNNGIGRYYHDTSSPSRRNGTMCSCRHEEAYPPRPLCSYKFVVEAHTVAEDNNDGIFRESTRHAFNRRASILRLRGNLLEVVTISTPHGMG